ncbi:MAG: polysaccharide biosynthesis protein [Cyclobacteriaceae bacterium]|nr:polysaccharide biosynthesis protein [Cyclobacteriaceae bacterium]
MFSNVIHKIKILPRWVIVTLDLVTLAFSTLLAYLLRFNFSSSELIRNDFEVGVLVYTVSGALAIFITGSYRGIIRYTGIQDGVRIFYMLLINVALVCFTNLVYHYNTNTNLIPYSVIFIGFLSSFLFLFNYRLLVKYFFSYYRNAITKRSNVLIYGAGQSGMITKQVIEASSNMRVVGFLEDDTNKAGKALAGSAIYFNRSKSNIEDLLISLNVDELVITAKDLPFDRKSEIVDVCLRHQVKVRTIPPIERWVRGELSLNQIKEINIEDLLGRDAIRLSNEHISRELSGKVICVTGAAGSIGREMVLQIINYRPVKVVLIDQAESELYELERELNSAALGVAVFPYLADITNQERIDSIFTEHKPQIVFHAAAYKHVPMMEGNPSEAVLCNILGTKCLADIAVKLKVEKFVMVSTDKAVNPTNVMGCSKRIAEIYVQSLNNHLQKAGNRHTLFVTTRFGNVLGSNGSVIPLFKKQIRDGGPVTVTHPEITRYFMTIAEACQLVLEAGAMGKGGEIFIFDMGDSVKILDLANKMIQLSGLEPGKDIEIVFTGLREGEKLYEELLGDKENTLPTHHPKIMKARVLEYAYTDINNYIELFWDLLNDRNELKMVALMKELVPEFKSNYSRYEVLDRQK